MAHVLTIVEGPQLWYELFVKDLEERQYTYKATHNKIGVIGPMVREVKILDITVPEQNLPELFSDLAPFVGSTSDNKRSALFLKKAVEIGGFLSKLFKGTKLHKIPPAETSDAIRRQALNIMPLFWFEDKICTDKCLILPKKGNGGELL